jgi:hypothetical protein
LVLNLGLLGGVVDAELPAPNGRHVFDIRVRERVTEGVTATIPVAPTITKRFGVNASVFISGLLA